MGTNNLIILFELLFYEYYNIFFLEIRISFKDYKKAIKKSIFKTNVRRVKVTSWERSNNVFSQCYMSTDIKY